MTHQMKGPQGSPTTEDKCSAAKGMSCQLDEFPFLLEGHAWTIVVGQHLELSLDFINVLPDGFWNCQEVLMQLTAVRHWIIKECCVTCPTWR